MRRISMKGSLPMSKTSSSTKPTPTKKSDKIGFDINDIKSLMALLNESEINEIEVTEGEKSIRLRKDPTPIVSNMPANVTASQAPQPAIAPVASLPEKKIDGKTIKAPMVGTFYLSPSPDAAPFINVGDKVKKGQTLCIIEAMKTMNQIEAEENGTIVEVLIDNAHPVEYGEPLFIIK